MKKSNPSLTSYAWLSIAAAVSTMGLKALAYLVTDSVGLLSDALESSVNLAGALMALAMLRIASLPADENHAYGHTKAEYFSSGVEGALILIAAVSIAVAAVKRFITPHPIEQIGLGLMVSSAAALVNLFVAVILMRAAKTYHSITLEANAHHLMTDVWTSAGVLVGVMAVSLTGWQRLDPLVAIFVAANIVRTGIQIVRRSILGLMDTAIPSEDVNIIRTILERYTHTEIAYHALRTRQSGSRKFVSFHILTPGTWTINEGHKLTEDIEADIRHALPNVTVFTHLEPLTDPSSWADVNLDRIDEYPNSGT